MSGPVKPLWPPRVSFSLGDGICWSRGSAGREKLAFYERGFLHLFVMTTISRPRIQTDMDDTTVRRGALGISVVDTPEGVCRRSGDMRAAGTGALDSRIDILVARTPRI